MTNKKEEGASRRSFLMLAATAAPAALAVTAIGAPAEAAVELDAGEARLQDTAHTRAYFDSARF
ncbi:twin-arginine translocation pathway signal protein [Profundibacterium mesophilum]|uniref:Twin-arginine translocation pathway signal sequence domain-containing protein n=1 Tax=Profundibacterium mesophilum KAUST100406-0324 TaxID=1037889 RepID=A0A921TDL5_9RHOB|nr:twin-arginine translocation pathway signal protein [Profundibacterium mesophilum]KAF0676948.1 twin-arginine translocation pathway signal sequence domain-containing protein [Profundibacterium mesophilum KAUST100406-0324]